jgi:peptidoglycan-N-acetylglucosamine deacetylase
MTHPRLTGVDTSEANTEITESKKYLEKLIGKKVVSFCYPGGKYSPINVKQVRKAGYKIARTTKTFKLNMDKNVFETPTSVHAYDHYTDIYKILIFIKFNPIKFLRLYLHWDNLAKEMFDKVLENGGVFHLWGHSWEIHGHKDWNRLEKVFEYISKRKNAKYVTNGKLI